MSGGAEAERVIRAVILTGTIGAGKTSVAEEISDVLRERRLRHALLDLDWLAQVYPGRDDDRYNDRLVFDNLAAIWPNLRDAGAEYLRMARVVEDAGDLYR